MKVGHIGRLMSGTKKQSGGILPEITQIVTVAPDALASAAFTGVDCDGSSGSQATFQFLVNGLPSPGEYIVFDTPFQLYYVWFTVDGMGDDPAPGGAGIEVDLAFGQSTDDIATTIGGAMNGNAVSAFAAGSTVIVSCFDNGNVSDPVGSANISVTSFSDGSTASNSVYLNAYMTLSNWVLFGTTWSQEHWYIWFNASGESSDPGISGYTGVEIPINYGDPYTTISSSIIFALATSPAAGKFTFGETGNVNTNIGGSVAGNFAGNQMFCGFEGPFFFTSIFYGTTNGLRGGDSVTFSVPGTNYYLWFQSNNFGSDPLLPGKTGIKVSLTGTELATAVASAIKTRLDAVIPTKVSTTKVTDTLTLTNLQNGPVPDANKRGTNFTITIIQQGQ